MGGADMTRPTLEEINAELRYDMGVIRNLLLQSNTPQEERITYAVKLIGAALARATAQSGESNHE
jgi:hypothetical protein